MASLFSVAVRQLLFAHSMRYTLHLSLTFAVSFLEQRGGWLG